MARVADIRKTVTDTTPVYAVVGLTDLAVEKVREARLKARTVGAELDPATLQARAQAPAAEAVEQGRELPALALNRTLVLAGKAQEEYETVVARGEKLVKRVRTQKPTQDLLAQAEATFALGKGAVTTVRRSATDIQRSAKATLTTGRREAVATADVVAESVSTEATQAATTAKQSAKRTRTLTVRPARSLARSRLPMRSARWRSAGT